MIKKKITINKGKNAALTCNAALLCLAALAVFCLVCACSELMDAQAGKDASFSITIGGGSRNVLTSTEIASLNYTITLTGGPDTDIWREGIKAGQTVEFSVAPGHWDITVQAYLDLEFRAEGFASVDLKPGHNDAISITMAQPITSVNITILDPVKDLTPSTVVDVIGNFAVRDVTWSPPDNTFQGGKVYTVSVTLAANSGYTFTGLSTATINEKNAKPTNNRGSSVILSHTFSPTSTKTVNEIKIKIQPDKMIYKHGEKLDLSGLVVTMIYDDDTSDDVVAENFDDKHITAVPSDGDDLSCMAHNGHPVIITYGKLTCATDNLTVNDATVNIADIGGVTAPVTGGTPVASITETGQYSGTVTWSPTVSDKFASETEYTATITLTAKANYTLQDVAADFFKVAGATATNDANSGVISAIFPQTHTSVNIYEIRGITAPATGGTPVKIIPGNEQYSVTVTWSPEVSGAFAVNTTYTATITLTPETGYTMTGVKANFFKVAGAATSNAANSGVVTAVFPATAPNVINISEISGLAPVLNGIPVTEIETDQYTGTVTWLDVYGNKFAYDTAYTAIIVLTPKAGYTMSGVEKDFFGVEGAKTSSNAANSGVVMAVFPFIPSYALGDTGPGGGKIFYYDPEGFTMLDNGQICHYLEAAPVDMTGTFAWASPSYTSTGISIISTAPIGAGRKNTAMILSIDANAPAAKVCKDYNYNDMTDWFLPSSSELNLLSANSIHIGNLNTAYYWSSSQDINYVNKATANSFGAGIDSNKTNKDALNNVRAVRAF